MKSRTSRKRKNKNVVTQTEGRNQPGLAHEPGVIDAECKLLKEHATAAGDARPRLCKTEPDRTLE
ncbi:MAG: hypothetical protein A3I66_04610 [Burkholderiales bacterium RIFCSPLOWO2_02_FULL_57_36]|nr:MAG: hypothetical protein A3I66_04610 [Burkholderiales bacterium RIFCSPLOWO2_02_FULL_57_36]